MSSTAYTTTNADAIAQLAAAMSQADILCPFCAEDPTERTFAHMLTAGGESHLLICAHCEMQVELWLVARPQYEPRAVAAAHWEASP